MTNENTENGSNSAAEKPLMLDLIGAAGFLDMSTSTLRTLVRRKEIIPYRYPGRTMRFKPEDLNIWRESRKQEVTQA